MQFYIGYRTLYDYNSNDPRMAETLPGETKFVLWDEDKTFKEILYKTERKFLEKACSSAPGESNFRFEITHLKHKALHSEVVQVIERQIIIIE